MYLRQVADCCHPCLSSFMKCFFNIILGIRVISDLYIPGVFVSHWFLKVERGYGNILLVGVIGPMNAISDCEQY